MKILLAGFGKIAHMPYLHFYLDLLSEHEASLIYWDRDGKPDAPVPPGIKKAYKFENCIEDHFPLGKKLPSFLKYRRFAKKVIKKGKFDFIIVLHSTTGITIADLLIRRYHKKYIFDFRDITREDKPLYRCLIHALARSASLTFVSSNAFRKYLPDSDNIYASHNILLDSLNHRDFRRERDRGAAPLRIRYWGLTRHTKINLEIIRKLANDGRFELHYHGREQETARELKRFCAENGVNNVFFHGEYKPWERYAFAEETDLIHNFYENDNRTQGAMGNKFYDGVIFKIPSLCTAGSYMGELSLEQGVGAVFDPCGEGFSDDIYHYYQTVNWERFEACCDRALEKILAEYAAGRERIKNVLKEGEETGV